MTNREWITNKLNDIGWSVSSKLHIYSMYSSFIKDQKSNISKESFKRLVRKVYSSSTGTYQEDGNIKNYINIEKSNNNVIISYKGPRIVTKDQLIDVCDIDIDEWYEDKCIINKWEVGRKNKTVSLSWNNGVIDGGVSDKGNIFIEPLFQVKLFLTKKVLGKSKLPPFNKIEIHNKSRHSNKKRVKSDKLSNWKTALIGSDAQMGFSRDMRTGKLFPLHDRNVFSLFLHAAIQYNPDVIVLNGDWFDLADLSDKFFESPEFYHNLQPVFIEFAWWMKEIRKNCPNSEIIFLAGNHEDRLRKSIVKYHSYAYGLKSVDRLDGHDVLSIPNLAAFDDLDIQWKKDYPYSYYWLNDIIEIRHGYKNKSNSGGTVNALIKDVINTTLIGHIHKFEHATRVVVDKGKRKEIEVWSFGTMSRVDGKVPSSITGQENWQQGFGKIDYSSDDYFITPIKVTNNKSLLNGTITEGYDPSFDIAKDSKWPTLDISNEIENDKELYISE